MIKNELSEYLESLGASLVGFADLSNFDTSSFNNMNYGIAFGIKIGSKIIEAINEGPTKEYYEEYTQLNKDLDNIVISCVKYIEDIGYNAIGQTSTYVTSDNKLTTPLPHKTVATRAGLGWIGKNALLITPKYGSAIRISSVITNMPLLTDIPINESKCGTCTNCVNTCPASAIKGTLWNFASTREELLDPFKCRKKARELSNAKIGIEISLCGKCIEVCPFTKRYTRLHH
ncbi:MAG: 4Fe-4S double cluster binding domain-containing protein [Clostridium sp.]|uniref:4Fe-4S double cluster binding domain-containing protein n=1 Tax=Clostridium sp. TaxID=1506 RepID=UPI003D6D51E7